MNYQRLEIPDIVLIKPDRFLDDRGFFSETFNSLKLAEINIKADFVQDNHSLSREPGTIRGLHFQSPPFAQDKLVRVTKGKVLDVAVDIRRGSPNFGKYVSAILSAQNWAQLWIPKGFAHGFCTLEADTEFLYKVTNPYAPDHEQGIAYNDPEINIDWNVPIGATPNLSLKDQDYPTLAQLPSYFEYNN